MALKTRPTAASVNPTRAELAPERLAAKWLDGVGGPPTDLDAIAAKLGVIETVSGEISGHGELQRHGDGLRIVLAEGQSPTRRRFTLAHELGHAIVRSSVLRPPRGGALERLCDRLAAELLMPKRLFVADAGERPDLARVRALAERYRCSIVATALRCAELTAISAFASERGRVVWRQNVSEMATRTLMRFAAPGAAPRRPADATFDFGGDREERVQVARDGTRLLWLLIPTDQRRLLGDSATEVPSRSVPSRPFSHAAAPGTPIGKVGSVQMRVSIPGDLDRALWAELRRVREEWSERSTCADCSRAPEEGHNAARVWRHASTDLISALVAVDGRATREQADRHDLLLEAIYGLTRTWNLQAIRLASATDALEQCRARVLARASEELERRTKAIASGAIVPYAREM